MRFRFLIVLAVLALAAPACKSRKPVVVDTSEAADIPREVALQKLRELLPTADYTNCTKTATDSPPYSSRWRGWTGRLPGV